jgi:O-antigen/teichoic acid export membrane protein
LLFDLNFLAGGLALLIVAWAGGEIVAAATAQVVLRVLLYLLYTTVLRRLEPWWHPGWRLGDRATIRRLLHPSMASFVLAAANSFGLQGIVLTLGWVFGPATAAIFATSRMLTRIPLQFSMMLTRASLPELTRAQSTGDTALTRRLMRLNSGLVMVVMGPAALLFALAGPWLLDKLSHGKMAASHLEFLLYGMSAAFCAVWTALGTRLIAINRQGAFAYLALGLYAAVALVPFIPGMTYTAILIGTVLAEVGIALRVVMWKGGKS